MKLQRVALVAGLTLLIIFPASLLSSHAGAGFLTYPFSKHPDMSLLAGWYYSDGSFHGAIDYIKGRSNSRYLWQPFDVLAAAEGSACWTSGGDNDPGPVVVIKHNVGGLSYETHYLHLNSASPNIPRCPRTAEVGRGQKIGLAGDRSWDRCPPPCVHLHFEVRLNGKLVDPYGLYDRPWRYPQPNTGSAGRMGANNLWTTDPPSHPLEDTVAPVIHLYSPPLNSWYSTDERISWKITDEGGSGVKGFSAAWDRDPGGLPPQYEGSSGYLNLSQAGEGTHTAHVRAWDSNGNEAYLTRGWLGYDSQPPSNPTTVLENSGVESGVWQNITNDPAFTWSGASDALSGVRGYNVYWGTNPSGVSETWTADTAYDPGPVAAGTYYLRIRTSDHAGNWSPWETLFTFKYR